MRSNPLPIVMLILAFFSSLTLHLLLFSYSQLKEAISLEMNLSYAEMGFIFSVSVLALVVLRIPWGLVIDRIGFKASLGIALTLIGISGTLRGFASNYATLLLFQLLLGIGFAAIMPCMPKIISSWFRQEATGFAIGTAISGFAIGDIIGLSATPYLLTHLNGWRNVFFLYGFWAILVACLWWVLAKENKSQSMSSVLTENHNISIKKNFTRLLGVKQLWLLTGIYFCASVCYDTFLLWFPSILDAVGISMINAGLITSMLPLGFIFASFIIGSLSDRIGLRKPFIIFLSLISGPVIYAAGTLQGLAVWFLAFILGFCTIGVLTLVITVPVELEHTAASVGSAIGIISSFGNFGSFLMPTVVGLIKDVTGSFLGSIVLLAVFGEFMLFLGLALTETGRKKRFD
jgi:cyanate permease